MVLASPCGPPGSPPRPGRGSFGEQVESAFNDSVGQDSVVDRPCALDGEVVRKHKAAGDTADDCRLGPVNALVAAFVDVF